MPQTNFENLEIYQLSEQLLDEIWRLTKTWSAFEKSTLGGQIVRSADSIGANIAEGTGRGSKPETRRFARMARGSLNETQHWLRRAYRRDLLNQEDIERLKPLVDELAPRLNAYIRSIM
ncbi:four helix bundle protein [bacterium]|nr:four helix bundle protein [bacterium]